MFGLVKTVIGEPITWCIISALTTLFGARAFYEGKVEKAMNEGYDRGLALKTMGDAANDTPTPPLVGPPTRRDLSLRTPRIPRVRPGQAVARAVARRRGPGPLPS
jgi:hypothetical protein